MLQIIYQSSARIGSPRLNTQPCIRYISAGKPWKLNIEFNIIILNIETSHAYPIGWNANLYDLELGFGKHKLLECLKQKMANSSNPAINSYNRVAQYIDIWLFYFSTITIGLYFAHTKVHASKAGK